MNGITFAAMFIVAILGAGFFVAWAFRRERARAAKLIREKQEAGELAMARPQPARRAVLHTAEGFNCVNTEIQQQAATQPARKLGAGSARPSYRAPAPAAAAGTSRRRPAETSSQSDDWITPSALAVASWHDDTPAPASAPAFVSGGGGDYSGGGASGSWSDSSSSSSCDSGSSLSDSGSSSSSSD